MYAGIFRLSFINERKKNIVLVLRQTSQCPLVNFQSADQTRMIKEYNGDIIITVTSHQNALIESMSQISSTWELPDLYPSKTSSVAS